jgi:hypothetical protein
VQLILDEFKEEETRRRRSILSQVQKNKKNKTPPALLEKVRGLLLDTPLNTALYAH